MNKLTQLIKNCYKIFASIYNFIKALWYILLLFVIVFIALIAKSFIMMEDDYPDYGRHQEDSEKNTNDSKPEKDGKIPKLTNKLRNNSKLEDKENIW